MHNKRNWKIKESAVAYSTNKNIVFSMFHAVKVNSLSIHFSFILLTFPLFAVVVVVVLVVVVVVVIVISI